MSVNKNKVIAAAQRFAQRGQFDRAIGELRTILEDDPEDVRVWHRVADLQIRKGSIPAGIATYEIIARHYEERGFFLKAVAVYKKILQADSTLVEAHRRLGELYVRLGLGPEAISEFQFVVGACERDGLHAESLELLENIVELGPDDEANRIRLAEAHARQGDHVAAIEQFNRALTQLRENGDLVLFTQVAERLLYLYPDQLNVLRSLSEVYLERDDPKRALARLQRIFRVDPSHVPTLELIAQAFVAIEQRSKAESVYREIVRTGDRDQRIRAIAALAAAGIRTCDIFIVCDATTHADARHLKAAVPALRCFVALDDLEPGEAADEVVPAMHRDAVLTAILVPGHVSTAWSRSEDVARAIARARTDDGHRVVPIYLSGDRPPTTVDYGLRRLHGLYVEQEGWPAIGKALSTIVEVQRSRPGTVTVEGPMADLASQLADVEARIQDARMQGQVTAELLEERVLLKRAMREGGELRAGDILDGRYTLQAPLGHGGFARVWQAYDRDRARSVAVKILHARFGADSVGRSRFARGARQMERLEHPHIVRVLEADGSDLGRRFYVMSYMSGGDLAEAVLAGRVQPADARWVARQIGNALAFAHSHGMVHRDVKPANILLDQHGRACLADFDLVRAPGTTGATRHGDRMGSFIFTAPECEENASEAGPAADVFGLAMTLVCVLAGRALTRSDFRNTERTIDRLDAPTGVREALKRAVEWDVERRTGQVADLLAELEVGWSDPLDQPPAQRALLPEEQAWLSDTNRVRRARGLPLVTPEKIPAPITQRAVARAKHRR